MNGLFVLSTGDTSSGTPARITAMLRPGEGEILDIQREVKPGGALHSKGALILSSPPGRRYGLQGSLSLSVILVFEQTCGTIDGDSAATAELCTILSAVAGILLLQRYAITGPVDQFGNVQAIGGGKDRGILYHLLLTRVNRKPGSRHHRDERASSHAAGPSRRGGKRRTFSYLLRKNGRRGA